MSRPFVPATMLFLTVAALVSPPACVQGFGDSFDSATMITPGLYTNTEPVYRSDFFKITVPRGTTLAAFLQFGSATDYDLFVYDVYRQEVVRSTSRELGASERTQYTTLTTGYHFLEVRFVLGGQSNYTLTVDLSRFIITSANWGPPGSPEEVSPGDTGASLSVTVRNENDYAVTGLLGALNVATPFTDTMGGSVSTSSYSGIVASGQTFTLSFLLNTASSAAIGVYAYNLTLSSYEVSGSGLLPKLPVNLTTSIPLTGKSFLQAAISPQFLTPGIGNLLTLNVSNVGTATASSLQLVVRPPSPLVITGSGDTWSLGTLNPGETTSVTFSLYVPASSQLSTYQLAALLSYTTVVGSQLTVTRALSVVVLAPESVSLQVIVEGQSLTAGQANNLTVTVSNRGLVAASSMELVLGLPQPLVLARTDNRWMIPLLEPSHSSTITATVYAPEASQGTAYTATLDITYLAPGGMPGSDHRTIALMVPIPSAQTTLSLVSVYWGLDVNSPEQVAPGDRNQRLSVTVQNTGTKDLSFVEAQLDLASSPLTNSTGGTLALTEPPTSLRVGSSTSTTFTVNVAADAELSTYLQTLRLYYLNVTGGKEAIQVPVPVPVLGRVTFSAFSDQTIITPGNSTYKVRVVNEGSGAAHSVHAALALPYPLVVTESSRVTVDSLKPGESTLLTAALYVPQTAVGGSYRPTVSIGYSDPYGFQRADVLELSVAVVKVQVVETSLTAAGEPREAPVGVARRIYGRLTRADTGVGVPGATIHLDVVDPRLVLDTISVVTDSFGYWEVRATPNLDGTYVYTARFGGGPTPQDPAVVYSSSRSETSLEATSATEILSPSPWQVASPGDRLTFPLQIANRGLRTETYFLNVTGLPAGALTSVYANNVGVRAVQVAPGQTASIALDISLPESLAGGIYRFQFTAKGEFAEGSVVLTVTVEQPVRQIELSSPFITQTAPTGQSLSYPLRVSNLGIEREQVFISMNLTTDVIDWTASFTEGGRTIDSVILGPGESQWIVFTVSPPYLVKVGRYHLLLFAATQDGKYNGSLGLTAEILGSYKVEIGFQPVNPTVAVGESTEVTVVASNTGESPVTGLRLNVNVTGPSPGLAVTVVPVDVLSLAVGDRATFVLRIAPASTAATGDYTLRVEAVSTEGSFGARELAVSVQTAVPWLYIEIGIAAVAAGVGVLAVERVLSRLRVRVRKG